MIVFVRPFRCRVARMVSCVLVFPMMVSASMARPDTAGEPDLPRQLVVGAMVAGREVGTLLVLAIDAQYFIPVQDFSEICGCPFQKEPDRMRLKTPLGPIELHAEDVFEALGTIYLRQTTIETKLSTPMRLNERRYALEFDFPWRTRDENAIDEPTIPLVADVVPPHVSVSTLRSDARLTRVENDGFSSTQTALGGRLGSGYWRVRYEDDLGGQRELRDYTWLHQSRRRLFMAGNQRVRLHPLLAANELTGAQFAWTNTSMDRFTGTRTPDELLSRRLSPVENVEGYGPAAGIAELRVNGRIVGRRRIGLDGAYSFRDVVIPVRRANRVEVLLYERHDPSVPVEIREITRAASEYLLDEGALVQRAGAGRQGNALKDILDPETNRADGALGFYQTRYGVTDGFTVESAVQFVSGVAQGMGGFVKRLGSSAVTSFGVGTSEGRLGYNFDFDWYRASWRLLAQSQVTQSGFQTGVDTGRLDHYIEYEYRWSERLEVGAVGRSRRSGTDRALYLLPAFSWRPTAKLITRGRPDIDGKYRFDAGYRIQSTTRLSATTVAERVGLRATQQIGERHALHVASEFGDDRAQRDQLVFSGYGAGWLRPSWSAGFLRTGGEPGYLVAGEIEVLPGVRAGVRFESNSRAEDPGSAQQRTIFSVTSDLGFAGSRVVAARSSSVRQDRGAVAGTVRIEAPTEMPRYDLGDLPVLRDGRIVGRTDARGRFFIGSLPPGIYRFELGTENLPIELVPRRAVVTAEVAGAAVTRADFVVEPEFGVAGRVRDASGRPVARAVVELSSVKGRFHKTVSTDLFGLFRIDGVPIGRYVLRLVPDAPSGEATSPEADRAPARKVVIRNDFLFDQDLELPTASDNG